MGLTGRILRPSARARATRISHAEKHLISFLRVGWNFKPVRPIKPKSRRKPLKGLHLGNRDILNFQALKGCRQAHQAQGSGAKDKKWWQALKAPQYIEKGTSMTEHDRRPLLRVDPAPILQAEVDRVAEIKARAAIPAECGDAIPSAPGRGAFVMYTPRETVRTENGAIRVRPAGYAGRRGLRVGDAFDTMQAQSQRRRNTRKGGDALPPLFTQAQITAGREYAALFERYQKAGVRCASFEAERTGGSGGSFIDAVIADGQRLRRMRAAIGDGWAMEPRRVGPHGDRRRAVRIMELVNRVCLQGQTISQVLRHFGWSTGLKNADPLMTCLRAALDRMYDADRVR